MRILKCNRGVSSVEMMLSGSIGVVVTLAMASILSSFNGQRSMLDGKSDVKISTTQKLVQMTYIGRLANWCQNQVKPMTELRCEVEFEAGRKEQAIFTYNSADKTLTYTRGSGNRMMTMWTATDVEHFTVCNGAEIRNGFCVDGNVAWSGTALASSTDSIGNFFRVSISTGLSYLKAGQKVGSGSTFALQGGFYTRNAGNPAVKYVYTPMGGVQ